MPGRSLHASQHGIDRARQALARRNLIQKSLMDEGIASWSTINKFFTGKPVARTIFLEICHRLDLDWQELVEPPDIRDEVPQAQPVQTAHGGSEGEPSPLLKAVQDCSAAAREALTPRILARIPREIVREKYLPAIHRGVTGELQRVIPIVGPAGYGKSTILGDIYDEFLQADVPWVGLILCSNLALSTGFVSFTSYSVVAATFTPASSYSTPDATAPSSYQASLLEIGLGKSLCGQPQSILTIVEQLIATQGRGVLLIDTLDLVINRAFVPAFGLLLRQLLDKGATVVFTCRDQEYNDFLEPTRERLAGLSQYIDRHTVPNFTTAEIRAAAEAFFRQLEPNNSDRGTAFANDILALSADYRSLLDIIQNPLLLALLCDLFAVDGTVPPDLTVSKLYQRYWQEKVAHSRLGQQDSALLAIEKENFCLTLARMLFELSKERLCESIYRDELPIQFTEIIANAYQDLLSEGVIERLPSRKIHFFHQTLLEYAIAYWLTRHTAQSQCQQLLDALGQPEGSLAKAYWLPVLRQLLTIVESEEEFEQLVAQLNIRDMGVFGVVVLAATSRDRPDALQRLLPTALELGEAYQRRLRQAISSAPRPLIETLWGMLLTLLEQAGHATAGNTAQLAGELIARWWQELKFKLSETLAAIHRRDVVIDVPGFEQQGDRTLFAGWLLQPCLPLIKKEPEPFLLDVLQTHLPILGYGTFATVIQLHTASSIPIETQQALLIQLLRSPVPKNELVERALCDFLTTILPDHVKQMNFPLGDTWSEILYQENLAGWNVAQAKAVGRWIANDQAILNCIVKELVLGDSQYLGQRLIALTESVHHGAASSLIHHLVQLQPERLGGDNCKCLGSLLIRCTALLSPEDQERVAQWLQPFTQEHGELICAVLNVLADASPTARSILEHVLETLSPAKQTQVYNQLLRFQPIASHPPLSTFDKSTQRFLVDAYRQQTATHPEALQRLLEASQCQSKDVALAASKDLDQISDDLLSLAQLFPLLRSRFPGVRANALRASITQVTQNSNTLTLEELNQICQILLQEENQMVTRLLCDLIAIWVRRKQQVPSKAIEAILGIPERLLKQHLFDGGTARSMMDALKAIAQSESKAVELTQLEEAIRNLLTLIDIKRIRNSESEMIDLLSAIHRLDHNFLQTFVHENCLLLAEKGWNQNISAILKTIRRVESQSSPLFDMIRESNWFTPEIRSIILEIKGS